MIALLRMTLRILPILGIVFLLCSPPLKGAGPPEEAPRKVILISIDGLAAFHLENPDLLLPNIHELAGSGVWAEGSETVFPSVTHPSHTTMVTGVSPRRHGVISNRVRNRVSGESYHITNKPRTESVRVPTLFDFADAAGLRTAAFFWPETRNDPSIDFNIPEVFTAEGLADLESVPEHVLKELEAAKIPIRLYFQWYSEPHLRSTGDVILTRSAAYEVEENQPDLLAIHILATDVMQHAWGAEHYLSQNALTVADHCVGLLKEAVEEAGLFEQTVFIITGDHGFITVPYEFNLWPLLEPVADRIHIKPQGWSLFIEEKEGFDSDRDGARLNQALQQIESLFGIKKVFRSEEFPTLGLPTYEENELIPGQYLIVADADTHLQADPDSPPFLEKKEKRSSYHGHGYLPAHPRMLAGFVMAGSGIKSGERLEKIRHLDIAPTIAYLLGLKTDGMEGRVLTEALAGTVE